MDIVMLVIVASVSSTGDRCYRKTILKLRKVTFSRVENSSLLKRSPRLFRAWIFVGSMEEIIMRERGHSD